ncbi:hypothetical protein FGO68_gene17562 [Halteria grandinella]|uniref:Uncharacterized protein n=1 Tax=Halteria grandinella TaxID=5974 RepID=A0A8J8NHE1_HALGN|nr:hypothetical protein FGO68_gene17562 [Halteria grandinella]
MNSTPSSTHKAFDGAHFHNTSQNFGHLYIKSDSKLDDQYLQPTDNKYSQSGMNSPEIKLRNDYTKQHPNKFLVADDTANSSMRKDESRLMAGITTISHVNSNSQTMNINGQGVASGKTMMLIVRNNESLDEGFSSVGQSQEGLQDQYIGNTGNNGDDEMLLTRTEAGMSFQFGSNVCSTQRSIAIPSANNAGEFEKRISDIKARLTEIKNSINTSEVAVVEQRQMEHLRVPSPVKRPSIFPYYHQQSVSSAYDLPQQQKQPSKDFPRNNSVQSLDQRLVHGKNSLQSQASSHHNAQSEKQLYEPLTTDMVLSSDQNTNYSVAHQSSQQNAQLSTSQYKRSPSPLQTPKPVSSQQHNSSLQQHHQSVASLHSHENHMLLHNSSSQQDLSNEHLLVQQIIQMREQSDKERKRHEQQMLIMQGEIASMCEVMSQHMQQRKQKRTTRVNTDKRERITELERQVQQLTQVIEKQTIDTSKAGVGDHSGEYSMAEQVTTIEQKMNRLNHNVSQSSGQTENEMLRAQVRTLQSENEAIRKSFSLSYQELLDAFNTYKKQMDEDLQRKQSETETMLRNEVDAKTAQVNHLNSENAFLRQKIARIKEVFDIKSPPRGSNRENYAPNKQSNDENLKTPGQKTTVKKETKKKTTSQSSLRKKHLRQPSNSRQSQSTNKTFDRIVGAGVENTSQDKSYNPIRRGGSIQSFRSFNNGSVSISHGNTSNVTGMMSALGKGSMIL